MFLQINGFDFRDKKLPNGATVHKDPSVLMIEDDSLLASAGLWLPEIVRNDAHANTTRINVALEDITRPDWSTVVDLTSWYINMQPEVLVMLRGTMCMGDSATAAEVAGRFLATAEGSCVKLDSDDQHYYTLANLLALITNFRCRYGDVYVYGNAEGSAEDTLLMRLQMRPLGVRIDYYPYVEQIPPHKVNLDTKHLRNRLIKKIRHTEFVSKVVARHKKWATPHNHFHYGRPSGKVEGLAGALVQDIHIVEQPCEGHTLVYGKIVSIRKKKPKAQKLSFTKKAYLEALGNNATFGNTNTITFNTTFG